MTIYYRAFSLAALAVLLCSALPTPSWSQEEEAGDAAAQPAPLTFPRTVESDAGIMTMHTPQIDTWVDFEKITGRVAVAVTPAGESDPVYGVAEFAADTDPNLELRVVAIENVEITVTSFPESDAQRREQLDGVVRATAQKRTHFVPLDVILTYIAPNAPITGEEGLSVEPPPIFFSSTPAVLVIIDGEPLLAPVPDTKLQYAVNTNWDLLNYKDKEWYLRHDKRWLKNKALSGDWKYDKRLPGDFKKLPDDGNWTEVKAAIPPAKDGDAEPIVFISDRPAELIVTDGTPNYRTVGGPGLEYVTDTESDLFLFDNKFYYLVSGRWFSATVLRGPWTHIEELPEVFATIPSDHEKGHVLAAVPDTDEARLAVLEAKLPRKATISRNAGETVNVFFQGEPEFEPIPGTQVERATNSPHDILKVGDYYYLCYEAVWYHAASTDGPWAVAYSVPDEIYKIPPTSPSYHVTHVKVYDYGDDYVETGYTSGYVGTHVSSTTVVYGSGWYYPSYYGFYYHYGYGYPYYPYYYPYPYSYGASTWYNPNTGRYGRSASVYGPYGGYGRSASYNPNTGMYGRGEAVWDSNEIAGRGVGYNPRTGTGVAMRGYDKEGKGWGESIITHNDKWVATQSEWGKDWKTTDLVGSGGGTGTIERQREGDTLYGSGEFQRGDQTLTTRSAVNEQGAIIAGQTGSGEQGFVGRSAEGDFYAGKDGSVYRRDEDGWHQNTGEGWQPIDVPDERAAQFDQARESAAARREAAGQSLSDDQRAQLQDRSRAQSLSTDQRAQLQDRASQSRASAGSGSFADSRRAGGDQWSGRTYDSSRNRNTYNRDRSRELNRSHTARTQGYQRYNNRSASGISRSPGMRAGGRRRR